MKKSGFTLIELLAVIILLSLIIFIVFPSITNSVRNYNKKTDKVVLTMLESASDLYISDNLSDFPKEKESKYCISINELIENDYLKNGIEYNGVDITHSHSIQVTYEDGFNYELVDNNMCAEYRNVCKLISGNEKEIGSKYECEVKPGTKYNFYVLSKEEDKLNLIMERNICDNGELATAENKCTVAWISDSTYGCGVDDDSTYCARHDKGPVTAMTYLHNATNDWINIPNMIMDYENENIDYSIQEKGTNGYGIIKTINNITTITDKEGNVTATYENLKARLPKYSEVKVNGCRTTSGSCPLWLVDYLNEYSAYTGGKTNITEIYGYWTLSSFADYFSGAWNVDYDGSVGANYVFLDGRYGSRPVITVLESSVSE